MTTQWHLVARDEHTCRASDSVQPKMSKQKCAYSVTDFAFGISQLHGSDVTTKDVDAYTKTRTQREFVSNSSRQRIVTQVKELHEGNARGNVRYLDGYAARCREAGHQCTIFKNVGIQVKDILRRSFKTEYNRQFKHVKEEDRDPFIVPDWVDEIDDNHIYSMGFAFSHAGLRKMRRAITFQKTYSDASFRTSNVEKGCHSWIGTLDANHNLVALIDTHNAQTESNATWRTAFGLLGAWDPTFTLSDGGVLFDIYGEALLPLVTSTSSSTGTSSTSSRYVSFKHCTVDTPFGTLTNFSPATLLFSLVFLFSHFCSIFYIFFLSYLSYLSYLLFLSHPCIFFFRSFKKMYFEKCFLH